ncbi:hypothetical protein PILCRDRAFT_8977 [Piloderma croceum F 1598]|uniref:Uncharacterized protein n=1 Tax=Piloderma croceum (strain F 1598) TaxID=765440 RepID=A0A0C3FQ63_PILCF|nr:hypothetical protein PILCRDRAFT_8977 [Piloderma croceum F 1598]
MPSSTADPPAARLANHPFITSGISTAASASQPAFSYYHREQDNGEFAFLAWPPEDESDREGEVKRAG